LNGRWSQVHFIKEQDSATGLRKEAWGGKVRHTVLYEGKTPNVRRSKLIKTKVHHGHFVLVCYCTYNGTFTDTRGSPEEDAGLDVPLDDGVEVLTGFGQIGSKHAE
jgi:hypothetical protein